MAMTIAEVRKSGAAWHIYISSDEGSRGTAPTRGAALRLFKERIVPVYQGGPMLLLIYTDIGNLDQAWRFYRGRSRRVNLASWLH